MAIKFIMRHSELDKKEWSRLEGEKNDHKNTYSNNGKSPKKSWGNETDSSLRKAGKPQNNGGKPRGPSIPSSRHSQIHWKSSSRCWRKRKKKTPCDTYLDSPKENL